MIVELPHARCWTGFTKPGNVPAVSKPSKSKSGDAKAIDGLSFEDALAQIESIIERIESGEVGLEQSLTEYEKGVGLINHCRAKLDRARQQVEDLTKTLESADEGDSDGGSGESGGDDVEQAD